MSPAERQHYLRALKLRRYYPFGFGVLLVSFVIAAIGTGVMGHALGGQLVGLLMVVNSTTAVCVVAVAQAIVLPTSSKVFAGRRSQLLQLRPRLFRHLRGYFRALPGAGLPVARSWWPSRLCCLSLVACLVTSQGAMPFAPHSTQQLVGGLFLVAIAIPSMCTPLLVLLGSFLAIAPTLVGYRDALDRDNATEHVPNWSDFDGYVHRLQTSRNAIERRSNIVGFHPLWGFPVLADTELYFEHQHVLGATGSGKTALSVTTDVIQLIRRNDGPVIVIDCKGDRALLETCRLESAAAGRKFKWFTNKPNHSTYIFNPLAHLSSPEFTLPEVLGVLLQSFNLFHGEEYGRAYFGKAVRVLLRAAFLATVPEDSSRRGFDRYRTSYRAERIESLWDLDDILQDIAANEGEYEAAKHLMMLVASLCDFDQLNLTASRDPHEPAVRHAISMPEVIREKQVAYFYLVGTMDAASVGEIARLALFSANSAAVQHRDRTGQRPRIYLVADEAQCLIASNVETVLQQARDSGIGLLLAHQSLSQLKLAGGTDLTSQVMNSTCIKRYHSARDAAMQSYISEISGTAKYYLRSWKQFKHRVVGGVVSSRYACTDADGVMRFDIAETLGPRLEPEDVRDISRDSNMSIAIFERNSGYAQFQGAFPMVTQWPTERGRDKRAWPSNDDETITISGAWPDSNEETIESPTPIPGGDINPAELDKKLRGLLRPEED